MNLIRKYHPRLILLLKIKKLAFYLMCGIKLGLINYEPNVNEEK